MTMQDKIKKISSEEDSNWIEQAEQDLRQARVRRKSWKVALRVLALLREKGITQTELADRMEVTRQQVTKIVKGKENLTLETIDKLEQALGVILLDVPKAATASLDKTILQTSSAMTATSTIAAVQNENSHWSEVDWCVPPDVALVWGFEPIDHPYRITLPFQSHVTAKCFHDLAVDILAQFQASEAMARTISISVSEGGSTLDEPMMYSLSNIA